MTPIVSVIMPVYNGEKFLRAAIDSILNQTYPNFELIILNDGSTDSTEAIISSYSDERIIYVKNEKNLRLIKTLNKGVSIARGQYIARMDADDVSLPWRFQKQLDVFREYDCDVASSSDLKINCDGNFIGPGSCLGAGDLEARFLLALTNPINHPTVMIKTDVLKHFLYTDSNSSANIEDYDLWLRLATSNLKFRLLAEPLLLYRRTGNNVTSLHLEQILNASKEVAAGIQILIFGFRSSDLFFEHFIMRKAEDGFRGVKKAVNELDSLFLLFCQKYQAADATCLSAWVDYLLIQSILRLRTNFVFRVVCLTMYFKCTVRYFYLRFIWHIHFSRLPEVACVRS